MVRIYQGIVSPILASLVGPLGRCRFEPSCSQYAVEAIAQRGALTGTVLAAGRLCRCQPWGGCGHDPVPLAKPHSGHVHLKQFFNVPFHPHANIPEGRS